MPPAVPAIPPAEPHLVLRLGLAGGRIRRALLEPRALPGLAGALVGLAVEAAIERVGRLTALCPEAHRVALAGAAEAAAGAPASPARRAARELLVLAERAGALALRRALAWPTLAGEPVRAGPARAILAAARGLARAVGLATPRGPLAPDRPALVAAGAALEQALAPLEPDPVVARLVGEAAGLGPRAGRAVADALLARLAADRRLLEEVRARIPRLAAEPAPPPLSASGRGAFALDTDRGRLTYRLALAGGRIAALARLAPTDRAILGETPILRALEGARPSLPPARAAALAMAAIDPCWPWRLALEPAAARPARAPAAPPRAAFPEPADA